MRGERRARVRGRPGVEAVVANLSANTVRVVATAAASADDVAAAVTAAGHKCRLVGQGALGAFGEDLAAAWARPAHAAQSLAAVASSRADLQPGSIAGVVRFVQVDEETCVWRAISELEPGRAYAVTVRVFGDVTGVESVGGVWENGGERAFRGGRAR